MELGILTHSQEPGTSPKYFNGFVSGCTFKIAHNSRGGIPGRTRSLNAAESQKEQEEMERGR